VPEAVSNLQIRSDTPSTVLPHPQQKAVSPASHYVVAHHHDAAGHHGDVPQHYYSDNNNENEYPMHGFYGMGTTMTHHAMQQHSMQSYYSSCPNSPESLANKTLTELNSLPPYSCDAQDQVNRVIH
jgi:hypothetical protein